MSACRAEMAGAKRHAVNAAQRQKTMQRIGDELRRRARTDFVRIEICKLLGMPEGFMALCRNEIPKEIKDELACDGIQLIQENFNWYLGPLDE